MQAHCLGHRWSVLEGCSEDVEDTRCETCFVCEVCKSETGERCLRRWLDDHSAACGEGGTGFSEDHGDWEVPWHQCHGDTKRLLDDEGTSVGS